MAGRRRCMFAETPPGVLQPPRTQRFAIAGRFPLRVMTTMIKITGQNNATSFSGSVPDILCYEHRGSCKAAGTKTNKTNK